MGDPGLSLSRPPHPIDRDQFHRARIPRDATGGRRCHACPPARLAVRPPAVAAEAAPSPEWGRNSDFPPSRVRHHGPTEHVS
jgi:hypothetical protein